MNKDRDLNVHMIPVDQITVLNPRSRGQEKFRQIVANISHLGLKKPIMVAKRTGREGQTCYDLVCGQGRLEAYVALGQKQVPALLVDGPKEDLLLMSLAENLARRKRSSLEMAREILAMKERGLKTAEIAKKVDLANSYVKGIIRLLVNGEQRLLLAVERRQIPMSTAIAIMQSNDSQIEKAMTEAYRRGELRGKALLRARSIIARRRGGGKGWRDKKGKSEKVSAQSLLRVYRREAARQKVLMARARQCEMRLRFVVSAMRKLLADEAMVNLLRAESLSSIPKALAALVNKKEQADVATG